MLVRPGLHAGAVPPYGAGLRCGQPGGTAQPVPGGDGPAQTGVRGANLGAIQPQRTYYHYKRRGQFDTPTGKFELWSTVTEKAGGDPLPTWTEVPESPVSRPDLAERYPLILTTGGRIQPYFISNNRQIKSLRRQAPFPIASLHPDTAKAAGIGEGDWIWIENQRGRVTQKAHLEPLMDPRVVNAQMGWWYPEADGPGYDWDVSNVNVLTCGDRPHDPVNGAYQLRALLCRVYPNPDGRAIEERYQVWMEKG